MTDTIDAAGNVAARVKPLKWHNYDAWTWWAEAICGTYHVEERHGVWKADLRFRDAVHIVYEIDDFETAIAAAEADYRARIAAALDVEKIVALVEAVSVTADEAMRDEIPGGYLPEESDEFHLGYDAAIKRVRTALAHFKEASHG